MKEFLLTMKGKLILILIQLGVGVFFWKKFLENRYRVKMHVYSPIFQKILLILMSREKNRLFRVEKKCPSLDLLLVIRYQYLENPYKNEEVCNILWKIFCKDLCRNAFKVNLHLLGQGVFKTASFVAFCTIFVCVHFLLNDKILQ